MASNICTNASLLGTHTANVLLQIVFSGLPTNSHWRFYSTSSLGKKFLYSKPDKNLWFILNDEQCKVSFRRFWQMISDFSGQRYTFTRWSYMNVLLSQTVVDVQGLSILIKKGSSVTKVWTWLILLKCLAFRQVHLIEEAVGIMSLEKIRCNNFNRHILRAKQ